MLNSAKSELQQKIEMMVQHHVVIREHGEPVHLNEDQRGAVAKWHKAQSDLFAEIAAGRQDPEQGQSSSWHSAEQGQSSSGLNQPSSSWQRSLGGPAGRR